MLPLVSYELVNRKPSTLRIGALQNVIAMASRGGHRPREGSEHEDRVAPRGTVHGRPDRFQPWCGGCNLSIDLIGSLPFVLRGGVVPLHHSHG